MFSFENVVAVTVRYKSGRKLIDNQLKHMAVMTDVPYDMLKSAQENGSYTVYAEVRNTSSGTEVRKIDFSKMPEIIQAQLSIIEPFKIPSEKVVPASRKPRKKKPKEHQNLTSNQNRQKEISNKKSNKQKINKQKEKPNLNVDAILDKIGKYGLKNITKAERDFLDSLSDNSGLREELLFVNPRNRNKQEVEITDRAEVTWEKMYKKSKGYRVPEIDELEALYYQLHKKGFGNFKEDIYWSATKFSIDSAWYFDFKNGRDGTMNVNLTANVRYIK